MSKRRKKNGGKKGQGAYLDDTLDKINEVIETAEAGVEILEQGTLPPITAAGAAVSGKQYKPCRATHPVLDLDENNLTLPGVRGGSCGTPITNDCDIYIGFDAGMRFTARQFPWTKGHEVQYLVQDRCAPKHAPSYLKLVDWTLEQIKKGAKVHAGCIGGHGRTGMFFAALVARLTGRKDAIEYVRQNYCKKAVESEAQIKFLMDHFGCDKAKPSKPPLSQQSPVTFTKTAAQASGWYEKDPYRQTEGTAPLRNDNSIWGKNAKW